MWWGGGGASPPDSEGTDPQLDIEGTSPIPIRLNQDKEILKVFIQFFVRDVRDSSFMYDEE